MYKRQDSDNTLEAISKQIAELKKKIQLAEGQRRAHYEEWDTEKRINEEKIRTLKDQIKTVYDKLALKISSKESAKVRFQNEVKLLLEKESNEAQNLLDLKVIDLQKKMDLLNHEIKQKKRELLELSSTNSVISKGGGKMNLKFEATSKKISELENQIHLVQLNTMEANHLRQKYKAIKNQLTDESVAFESILNKLEQKIKERELEISHLQKVYNEAKSFRDVTTESLTKQEQELMKMQDLRNSQLAELKSQVEHRKFDLENLERQMFSNRQKSIRQKSTESDYSDSGTESSMELVEKAFSKLKEVTGVTENEDVRRRFLSQKDTAAVLQKMKGSIEKEKRNLEKQKEEISMELEACKFVEGQTAEQNKEEIVKLKFAIEEKEDEFKGIQIKTSDLDRNLTGIINRIHEFCLKIKDADAVVVPIKCPPVEKSEWLFHILRTKLESLNRIKKQTVLRNRMQTSTARRDTLNTLNAILPAPSETKTSDVDDEEEEIPTRNSLKKEAQLIYETKSRRKGFRIH